MVELGRTMTVAAALARGRSGDKIIKAAELIQVKPAQGRHLGLAARRALNLMIQVAAGEAWTDKLHKIPKKVLRQGHESNDRLPDILAEITTTHLEIHGKDDEGNAGVWSVPILRASFEPDDARGEAFVRFQFTEEVRVILSNSNTYASLEAQAVLAMSSRYSLALYEIGAQIFNQRDPTVDYSVEEFRKLIGVPDGTLKEFTDLRRKALDIAKAEIDQLAPFTFNWKEYRHGRRVTSIRLEFWQKDAASGEAAVNEVNSHSVGRRARRQGKVEAVEVAKPLPAASPAAVSIPSRSTGIPGVPPEDIERLMKSAKRPQDIIARAFEAEKLSPGRGREIIQSALTG
jgi:hypothetical protein